MKHYKKPDGSVWAFEADGSQDKYVTGDMVLMTALEVAAHNMPKPAPPPESVSMKQMRLALVKSGRYTPVVTYFAGLTGDEGLEAKIHWEFSNTVSRKDTLTAAITSVLSLTAPQLDELFSLAGTL